MKMIIFLLIILVLVSACSYDENVITECQNDSECVPTCAYGCVNASWADRDDCDEMAIYKCECINNSCGRIN